MTKEKIDPTFADWINRAYKAIWIDPKILAQRAWVSLSHIYAILRYERSPGLTIAKKISGVLGLSLDEVDSLWAQDALQKNSLPIDLGSHTNIQLIATIVRLQWVLGSKTDTDATISLDTPPHE